ncbi:MAG: ABC transporter ATP-binding protein [Candidatus Caldarchaeum sp.]
MLRVVNVTKKFGELTALSGVSFEVRQGECVGIIGPNGAGKTTLFNIISGFMKPNAGRVEFMGVDVTGKPPHELVKRGIARTFQVIKTFKTMTVLESLSVVNDNVDWLVEEIGLSDRKNFSVRDLPQGDLRRLSIAMALAARPKLLLLDEPFSGLSPREGVELGLVIEKLRRNGLTMVIVEHKLRELFNHVSRVLVLNYGRLICEGSPQEVVEDRKVVEAYRGVGYDGS